MVLVEGDEMTVVTVVVDHGAWGNGTVTNPVVVVLLSMELVDGTLLAEMIAGTESRQH